MSQTVTLLRGNETLPVFGGSPYWFVTMTGIGLPSIERIKERSPLQDGSTDVGYRLNDRLLNLVVLIDSTTLAGADAARDTLAEMLKPLPNNPIKIRIQRDDGELRQIDGNVTGIVDFPNTFEDRMWSAQKVIIQFDCPDPIPYDPAIQQYIFSVQSSASSLLIPLEVPVTIDASGALDDTQVIDYAGSISAKPTIYITGPATGLVITNETTGKILSFEGHSIADGDTYTVNLATRRIVDQNGVRKLAALTDGSNLFTWALETTPTAINGVNQINVSVASGISDATRVRFEFYNRYTSV